eukprot:scaffold452_cov235-Pinguiococcus_pyrenoidosus.AAC.1
MTNARDTVRGRDTWRTPSRARDATPYYIQYDLRAIDIRKLIDMQAFDNSRNWSRGFPDFRIFLRISEFQSFRLPKFPSFVELHRIRTKPTAKERKRERRTQRGAWKRNP